MTLTGTSYGVVKAWRLAGGRWRGRLEQIPEKGQIPVLSHGLRPRRGPCRALRGSPVKAGTQTDPAPGASQAGPGSPSAPREAVGHVS